MASVYNAGHQVALGIDADEVNTVHCQEVLMLDAHVFWFPLTLPLLLPLHKHKRNVGR